MRLTYLNPGVQYGAVVQRYRRSRYTARVVRPVVVLEAALSWYINKNGDYAPVAGATDNQGLPMRGRIPVACLSLEGTWEPALVRPQDVYWWTAELQSRWDSQVEQRRKSTQREERSRQLYQRLNAVYEAFGLEEGASDYEDGSVNVDIAVLEAMAYQHSHRFDGTRALPDHDNHHNAGGCPYCTDNGRYVLVNAEEVQMLREEVGSLTLQMSELLKEV